MKSVGFASTEYPFVIQGEYYNKLDIEGFSQMMKNPSYCYKFYWLEAIVKIISENVSETTFDEIINEMICNAWYLVRKHKVHLSGRQSGEIRDGLERAIDILYKKSNLSDNASKVEIINNIKKYDEDLREAKEQLTNMVPYRALSGFIKKYDPSFSYESTSRIIEYIKKLNDEVVVLPYTLGTSSKLKREVYFNPMWMAMIQENTVSILGWINYEKVKWLEFYNPETPRIASKLIITEDKIRKLDKVHDLWEGILNITEIRDVFNNQPIVSNKYDVDHFIPWSFLLNDELWNLSPMDSGLNSSKNNNLPKWDPFFDRFASNQYTLYMCIYSSDKIHSLFEKCYRDNLQYEWAENELYRKGNTQEEFCNILSQYMRPIYDSARRQGYELWNRETVNG